MLYLYVYNVASLNTHIIFAGKLVKLLDTKYNFFGIRFGIDPLLDVIPWAGDMLGAMISCYLFWIAYKLHVPTCVYWRMVLHVLVDYVFGLIPYIGIIFDVLYRSNVKNYALLRQYIDPDIYGNETKYC